MAKSLSPEALNVRSTSFAARRRDRLQSEARKRLTKALFVDAVDDETERGDDVVVDDADADDKLDLQAKDEVVKLLNSFLECKRAKRTYQESARRAKRAYLALVAYHDFFWKNKVGRDHGWLKLQKCMDDALVEAKRQLCCVSSRLSKDKRSPGLERDGLQQCRKDLSFVAGGLRKRLDLLQGDHHSRRRQTPRLASSPASLQDLRSRCPMLCETGDCRHLCEHRCFFREHEPARKLKEFRDSCEWHAGSKAEAESLFSGWSSRLEVCRSNGFKVVLVSPQGVSHNHSKKALESIGIAMDPKYKITSLYEKKIRDRVSGNATEVVMCHGPRHSPYGLIEELFWECPWKLLVCCLLLNQTTRKQLDIALLHFFERFPTPESLLSCSERQNEIEGAISPCGLQRKRTATLLKFTKEFLEKDWVEPRELHGVGAYAQEAYEIFCLGKLNPNIPVPDHALNWYVEYKLG
ncbi:DNA glycosylase [Chloropicon primus]|uniref:DNA glycosylase n=1 Tax=Chloropicon primus TaxID=1764295 RepID=A0A5B8MSN9_9CHLO|nr:DNA glycosylase [Chloropicon primus]UPR02509.1 DNA glycosylase [Chloropicon primus]|mmetsp:Transcript_3432/g.9601  ORF Transcript_3432/g.9601 Transcript_3432/m.9601 type:complete len:465 (-) Transcript_3432:898-2292(-)|eukprot:QDZ23297.1 DNA glycosylase [Chloropicon primus]